MQAWRILEQFIDILCLMYIQKTRYFNQIFSYVDNVL